MPFDHYLPATYLARFSPETTGRRRHRSVWAADKRTGKVFSTPVSAICGKRNLYTVDNDDPRVVDKLLSTYEGPLDESIDRLISYRLDALTWLRVLVPFVSALLVRGEEFSPRFERRLLTMFGAQILSISSPDNSNWARIMEMHRLRSSVLGAHWDVLTTSGRFPQITNDLGYAPFMHSNTGARGVAIPLDLRHVLVVTPTVKRNIIAFAHQGEWKPVISYFNLSDAEHAPFLNVLSQTAQRFIIGPDEKTIGEYLYQQDKAPAVPEPQVMGFMGSKMARRYENTYLNVLTILSERPFADEAVLFVDFAKNFRPNAKQPSFGLYYGNPKV